MEQGQGVARDHTRAVAAYDTGRARLVSEAATFS